MPRNLDPIRVDRLNDWFERLVPRDVEVDEIDVYLDLDEDGEARKLSYTSPDSGRQIFVLEYTTVRPHNRRSITAWQFDRDFKKPEAKRIIERYLTPWGAQEVDGVFA